MNARRGFLALIGGGAVAGVSLIRGRAAEPTLLLPKRAEMVTAPTIIRDEGEAALLAWYRQALPAERDCMLAMFARVSAGEDWASSIGQMLGRLGRTVPQRRIVPCVPGTDIAIRQY
jgi:hypothetical protein